METNIQTFYYDGFGDFHARVDENNIVWVQIEDAAYGLGYISVSKNGTVHVKWDKIRAIFNDSGYNFNVRAGCFIPENMFFMLAMRTDSPAARKFQKWAADEVFPALRRQGFYAVNPKLSRKFLLRELGKQVRKTMTAAACRFFDYAQQFGDRRSKGMIIGMWTNEGYEISGITKGGRDDATEEQLAATILIESTQRDGTDSGIAQRKLPRQIEACNTRQLQKLKAGLPPSLKNSTFLK